MKIYNGSNHILGRLASAAAKDMMNGENVVIINAEKLYITGSKQTILSKYIARRQIVCHQNPEHGPKWPKTPELLVRRIVRGMLPYTKTKGRLAFKKLKVYAGVPESLKSAPATEIAPAKVKEGQKGIEILALCKMLGYQPRNANKR